MPSRVLMLGARFCYVLENGIAKISNQTKH